MWLPIPHPGMEPVTSRAPLSTFTMWTLTAARQRNHTREHSIYNNTMDVMQKGCFGDDFDAIACVRNGIMSMLVVITGLLCVLKICKLHINRHPAVHQYIIFYTACFECLICAVHWIVLKYAQLDFIMQYLKLIQFLVVCHFYCTLASRVTRNEKLANRVLVPVFAVALIYFSIVGALGIVNVTTSWEECLQPYWLALSAAEFVLVQLFTIAGVYIHRRLNEISTLDSVRRAQKRDLWGLVIAFELSALVGMVYDLTLKTLGNEEKGCSGIFLYMQEIYTPVFGTFMLMKFLLPIWVMLFVFHPIEAAPDQEDLLPAISEDGTYTSVFTPPDQQRYKPMYHPGSADYIRNDASFGGSPGASPVSSSPNPGYSPMHRTPSNLATIRENEEQHSEGSSMEGDENDRKPFVT